jgi:cytochrome P450
MAMADATSLDRVGGETADGISLRRLLISWLRSGSKSDLSNLYRSFHRAGPALRTPWDEVIVTGYQACSHVLTHKRSWDVPDAAFLQKKFADLPGQASFDALGKTLFHTNAQVHVRRRRALSSFFTPAATSTYERTLQSASDRVVKSFVETVSAASEPCDAVETLVYPLMGSMLSILLGLPEEDAEWLARAGDEILLVEDLWVTRDVALRADAATSAVLAYLDQALRSAKPSVGPLASLWKDAQRSTTAHEDTINTLFLLISAAPGPTGALVSSSLLALSQLGAKGRDLAGKESAIVDEVVRFDPPGHVITRVATRDTVVGEVPVAKGTVTHALVGCASRDPAVYPDPDVFDYFRNQPRSLVFSAGPHYCLGAGLARLQAVCFVRAWCSFADGVVAVLSEHPRRPGPNLRQLMSLPMVRKS